jgi:GNAT superfamily N-acetyltransferase
VPVLARVVVVFAMVTAGECTGRWVAGLRREPLLQSRAMTADAIDDTGEAGPATEVQGGAFEWRRGRYEVSTDPKRLDVPATAAFLADTYWAPEIPESIVRRSIEHSIAFGLYDGDRQVGFARVISDRTTFAWVGDVFVLESHRGRGLALWLMRCVLAHPELRDLRRWMLASRTALGLYEKVGFRPLGSPERFVEIADPDVHRRQRARLG